ncbi:hypothetical protein OFD18_30655, partial [Escherichia coli]|nr:hypothetical protein [Escherichia coli]
GKVSARNRTALRSKITPALIATPVLKVLFHANATTPHRRHIAVVRDKHIIGFKCSADRNAYGFRA